MGASCARASAPAPTPAGTESTKPSLAAKLRAKLRALQQSGSKDGSGVPDDAATASAHDVAVFVDPSWQPPPTTTTTTTATTSPKAAKQKRKPSSFAAPRRLSGRALALTQDLEAEEALADADAPTDPITLTKIKRDSLVFDTHRTKYRAESLIDYLLATGSFREPASRSPFSDEDLRRLDELGAKLGKQSVLEAKMVGEAKFLADKEKRDAFDGLERCAGEAAYAALRVIETTKDIGDGQVKLLTTAFPQLKYYVGLMFQADAEAAALAANQLRVFLVGPPNRPTRDRSGHLLSFCLAWFDEMVQEAALSATAFGNDVEADVKEKEKEASAPTLVVGNGAGNGDDDFDVL